MFERLDEILWSEYTDFYARAATPIPALIRQLDTDDSEQQKTALDDIFDRICHQASTKDLTVQVIPFLVELLPTSSFFHKGALVGQLRTLAIGLDSDLLCDLDKIDTSYYVPGDCYSEVQKAVPDFMQLMDDSNRRVRIEAAYNLAWFPSDVRQSLPLLRHQLRETEQMTELANLILSVGLLEYQASIKETDREFVRPFLGDKRPRIRYAAAIYLDWHEPSWDVGEIMVELSENNDADFEDIPFHEYYGWEQYAENRLDKYER